MDFGLFGLGTPSGHKPALDLGKVGLGRFLVIYDNTEYTKLSTFFKGNIQLWQQLKFPKRAAWEP